MRLVALASLGFCHAHSSIRAMLCLVLLAAGVFGSLAASAGTPSLEFATSWGGPVNAVQVSGDVAFVGSGRRLVSLDISNPAAVVELDSIDLLSTVQDIALIDGAALVSTESRHLYGVCSVSVADPWNMTLLDFDIDSFLFPGELNLYGTLMYVEDRSGGSPHIYDISDPNNLVDVGKSDGLLAAEQYALGGNYLYRAEYSAFGGVDLHIYDLAADAINPPLIGTWGTPCDDPVRVYNLNFNALIIEGSHAYLAYQAFTDDPCNDSGVFVIDVSDPSSPTLVSTYTFADYTGAPTDVVVADGYAYIAHYPGDLVPGFLELAQGLVIVDVSNPAQPAFVASYKTHGAVRGVRIFGDRAYLFDEGEGLIIMDVSDHAQPIRLGAYHSPAYLRSMDKVGNLLYVVDQWNGFTILDVSESGQTPDVVGIYQTEIPERPDEDLGIDNWGIRVVGQTAYMSAGFAGLLVVDVSQPSAPVLIHQFVPPDLHVARAIEVTGTTGMVSYRKFSGACSLWKLRTYDLSKHAVMATLDVPGCIPASQFEWGSGGHLYAGRLATAQVLDITPPTNPALIYDGPPNPGLCFGHAGPNLDFVAKHATTGAQAGGIYAWNTTNPAAPVPLSYTPLSLPVAIEVRDSRAYVIGLYDAPGITPPFDSVVLYNVSTPSAPAILLDTATVTGSIMTNEEAQGRLLVDEPHVYVAAGASSENQLNSGLVILRVQGLPNPADLNGDGVVNGFDLAMLLGQWGRCSKTSDCPADLNHSGVVDGFDLAILLGEWG